MGEFDTEEYASLTLKAPNNNIGSVEKCVRSTKLSPPERTDDIKKWLQYACTHDYAHGKTELVEVNWTLCSVLLENFEPTHVLPKIYEI